MVYDVLLWKVRSFKNVHNLLEAEPSKNHPIDLPQNISYFVNFMEKILSRVNH